MRNIYKLLSIMFLFFALVPSYGQEISYKIIRNAAGCYEVYYKTSVAFNNTKISSAQVTIVAPQGTGALITSLFPSSGISFSPASTGSSFEVFTPPASAGNVEYLIFGINPFNATLGIDPIEFKLFSFCLSSSNCVGDIRLLQGLSQVSPWLPYDNRSGAADPTIANFDPYNAMNVDNNGCVFVQTAGTCPNTIDLYRGTNYGVGLANCPVPLATVKTASVGLANPGVAFDYILSVNNLSPTYPSNGVITITDTLQAGLTYNSGVGTGWTCNIAGQIVNCTTSSVILANSTSNPININVSPTLSTTNPIKNLAWTSGGGMQSGPFKSGTTTLNTQSLLNLTGGVPTSIGFCLSGNITPILLLNN